MTSNENWTFMYFMLDVVSLNIVSLFNVADRLDQDQKWSWHSLECFCFIPWNTKEWIKDVYIKSTHKVCLHQLVGGHLNLMQSCMLKFFWIFQMSVLEYYFFKSLCSETLVKSVIEILLTCSCDNSIEHSLFLRVSRSIRYDL